MKLERLPEINARWLSHPVWGAWIETLEFAMVLYSDSKSHPVWGAWIETRRMTEKQKPSVVAPRVGCVD